jgi:REP element-mobilizing transposase RayT
MAHPPRLPVWLRSEQSVIYFLTLCVANRQPVLANKETLHALKSAAKKLEQWRLLAAVIMPDHLHAIVTPSADRGAKLSNCSAALKRWIREELNADWKWQPGCFDRLLRSDESVHNKWLYLQNNPVRAGLVARWEDWPYRIGFEDQGTELNPASGALALQRQHHTGIT